MTSTTHQPDVFTVAPLESVRPAAPLRQAVGRLRRDGRALVVYAIAALALLGALGLLLDGHLLSWLAGLLAGAAVSAGVSARRAHPSANSFALQTSSSAALTAAASTGLPGAITGSGPGLPATGSGATTRDEDGVACQPDAGTAEQLAALRAAGWQAVEDLEGRFGRYEHVAVGPGGVVLLQSRRLAHPVPAIVSEADPATRRELTQLRRGAIAAAANLREELELLDGRRCWVQTVVVVWSEFAPGRIADGRCVMVSGPRLADWLRRRPEQLSPERGEELLESLQSLVVSPAA